MAAFDGVLMCAATAGHAGRTRFWTLTNSFLRVTFAILTIPAFLSYRENLQEDI